MINATNFQDSPDSCTPPMPPEPPANIKILHLDWDLIFVDPAVSEQAQAFGWADKVRQKIFIQSNLRPKCVVETVLHEIGHGIFSSCGIADQGLTEENVCSTLTGPMLCVVRDNPALFEWLNYLCSVNENT